MKVKMLLEALPVKLETKQEGLDRSITGVYCGDLLSWVMSHAKEGNIWLTIQGHINIIAVASLIGIPAIIVVEGSAVDEEVISKANEEGISVFTTKKTAYEIARLCNELKIGR